MSVIDQPTVIEDRTFLDLVSARARRLLGIVLGIERLDRATVVILSRPLLGVILEEATMLEELLDAYDARNNSTWFTFREMVASAKAFAHVGYTLLHLHHTMPRYRLLPVDGTVREDLHAAMDTVGGLLNSVSRRLASRARELGLDLPEQISDIAQFAEDLPPGILARDRQTAHRASAHERIVHLATSFLERAAESHFIQTATAAQPSVYASLIPDPIGEETLRQLESRFRNLLSLYDTYISDSDTEETDSSLRLLRSHISVTVHFMDCATVLVHFYERHHRIWQSDKTFRESCPLDFAALLELLMSFCLGYSDRFISTARETCHQVLRRYATVGEVEVAIPRYRGFHVRPSTLISGIVHHYGSDVSMHLNGEVYDAGSVLDLFRANEEINAEKRRHVGEVVGDAEWVPAVASGTTPRAAVTSAILELAERREIIIYSHPLSVNDLNDAPQRTLAGLVAQEVARLLATGKIDILADMTVTFKGDERVLNDIQVLTDHGYCEDAYGNNIAIPKEIAYLKRTRP